MLTRADDFDEEPTEFPFIDYESFESDNQHSKNATYYHCIVVAGAFYPKYTQHHPLITHLFDSNHVKWIHSFGRVLPVNDMKSMFLQSIETILSSKKYKTSTDNNKYHTVKQKPILLTGFSYGASILTKLYTDIESILTCKHNYSPDLIHFISIACPPILHMKTLGLDNVNTYCNIVDKRLDYLRPKLKMGNQWRKMYGTYIINHFQQWIDKWHNMYVSNLDNNLLYLTDDQLCYNVLNNQQSRFIFCLNDDLYPFSLFYEPILKKKYQKFIQTRCITFSIMNPKHESIHTNLFNIYWNLLKNALNVSLKSLHLNLKDGGALESKL